MSSPQLQIGLRVSWKLCRNLCSRRWLRSNLSLVINLIPLGLWQLKVEFEDGLLNFKILFLQPQEVLEFLTFKSKLFRSMTVDGKKKIYKKIMFTTEEGNLIISSRIICWTPCSKLSRYLKVKWLQQDLNLQPLSL